MLALICSTESQHQHQDSEVSRFQNEEVPPALLNLINMLWLKRYKRRLVVGGNVGCGTSLYEILKEMKQRLAIQKQLHRRLTPFTPLGNVEQLRKIMRTIG